MDKFIKKVITITIYILGLNLFIYSLTNDYYSDYFRDIDEKYKVILLADSHGAALGDLTSRIGIYNFSVASESYLDMSRKVDFLIKNRNVKRILISVDDHSLSAYRENMNNNDRSIQYCSAHHLSHSCHLKDIIYEGFIRRYFVLINIKQRDIIRARLSSLLLSRKDGIANWHELDDNNQEHKALRRFEFQFIQDKSEMLEKSLIEIIDVCAINNIELIGIKFPLSRTYSEIIGDHSFKADSVFRANNLEVIDLGGVFHGSDELFKDQDHVNSLGADSLVNILGKRLGNR